MWRLLCMAAGARAWLTINPLDPPYSAAGDGVTDDTLPLRAALAALAAARGGTLLLPAPHTFLSQAQNLTSNTFLNISGALLAASSTTHWPLIPPLPWYGGGVDAPQSGAPEWQPFLLGVGADNLTLAGGGVIDGGGAPWWACAHGAQPLAAPPCSGFSRPRLLQPRHASDFALFNLTLRNSPAWTIHLANVTRAVLSDFAVLAPASEGNTDGCDVDISRSVSIFRFLYAGGDDAVAVKAGLDWLGRTYGAPTQDVLVRNMTILSGNGFAIGSEMSAGIRNVTFEDVLVNCSASPCKHGLYIKTMRGRGGTVEGVVARNVRVLRGTALGHGLTEVYARPNPPPTNASATPRIRNVTVLGGSIDSPVAFSLVGLPESVIEGLVVDGVALGGGTRAASACVNATGVCRGMAAGACPPCLVPE
jgi:polygalacturonase